MLLSTSAVLAEALLQVNSDAFVAPREAPYLAHATPLDMFFLNGAALFWTFTYVLVIVHGFQLKRPMIPTAAILLNVSWEVLAVFAWPSYNTYMKYGSIVWLAFDAVIVYQLFRFGGAHQRIVELKRHWHSVVIGGLLITLAGHQFFSIYNSDPFGLEDSFMINLVMSVLFVSMYFDDRDASIQARRIAWAKMTGTASASIGLTMIMVAAEPPRSPDFLYYLMGACFLFDVLYVGILTRASAQAPEGVAVVT
jgi:hypothetical protein